MSLLKSENILGYPISSNSVQSCIEQIATWLESGDQKNFVCANPHSLMVAEKDHIFCKAIHSADMLTPDGVGIIIASKLLGGRIKERVTGSDVFEGVNNILNNRKNYRYFFLGSSPETLDMIRDRLTEDCPNIVFAGAYSPPYKDVFNEEDNRLMVEAINAARPDVLWVGMTAPKQEKWVYQNSKKLDVKFIGAIGAVFDFYVGNVNRPHPIYQKIGLEWLPRLIHEPRRLWRRNFVSSPQFILKVLKQKINGIRE